LPVFLVCVLSGSALWAQSHTERGILGGGAAGAVIGGIVGHQNDETAEGALIGGAVGAIAGGLLGNERDRAIQQQYYQQQQQIIRYQQGVSYNDVVVMSQNGVSPQVIINQIQANGVQQRPGVQEIIWLHQQGVSEAVLDAMQRARLATAPPVVPVRPVVIEHYHEPAVIVDPWHHHYDWHHHHHHDPGIHFHWGHHWHD
jgi:hypothetical protein